MTYDLDARLSAGGYVAGEPVNLALVQAWLESGGITVTSLELDPADPALIHVDASAEPTDYEWSQYQNSVSWQPGDPIPTPPPAGQGPDETPATETYILDLADTALGFAAGDTVRIDQVAQYLTEQGYLHAGDGVTAETDGSGAYTGRIAVTIPAGGPHIPAPTWAAFNGEASITVYGDTSIGDGAVSGGTGGTSYGYKAKATAIFATGIGAYAQAQAEYTSSYGHNAAALGDFASSVGAGSTADAYGSTAIGASATVQSGADRSFAIGMSATVASGDTDTGLLRANSVEIAPSRPGGYNDPTTLRLHDDAGTVHEIGTTDAGLTWDGAPVGLDTVPVQFASATTDTNATTTAKEYGTGIDVALPEGTWTLTGMLTMMTQHSVNTGALTHYLYIDTAAAGALSRSSTGTTLTQLMPWSLVPTLAGATVVVPSGGATVHVSAQYRPTAAGTATCVNAAFAGQFVRS